MHRARADADVFRAIADPTRRAILDRLRAGPAPVYVLADDFDQSRPAISKHLRVLRQARLVSEQRVGRERVYELEPAPLHRVAGWIEGYRAFWQRNLDGLKRYLEEER
jgi:DNA-binding transcriptional ArsR family regulator